MKKFFILLKYEINKLVVSPSTYFLASIFLSIIAAIFLFILREYVISDQEVGLVHAFFQCYWLPVLLSVPMLTIRTFSDDYKTGIMQVVKSCAVPDFAIVCSKIVAVYLFYVFLWSLSGLLISGAAIIASNLLHNYSFIDLPSVVGGYTYILVSGLMFISIGIFFSSLTENQVLAGMSTFVVIFLLFLNGQLVSFHRIIGGMIDGTLVRPLNLFLQMDNACFGVFDSRVIVLYLTIALTAIVFTKISLEKRFC